MEHEKLQFDLAVIGSGPAGEKAALEAACLGARVVVVERWGQPGGASVIFGTLPSKSLRETVQYINHLYQAEVTGLSCGLDHELTIKELMYRKDRVTKERVEGIYSDYQRAGVEYLAGEARLLDPEHLQISHADGTQTRIHAKKCILATGTRPYHPPDVPFDHEVILDSDSILTLKGIPKSMIIFGGGVIGSEYCSIFSRLGTKVMLVEATDRILGFVDRDLSEALMESMRQTGVELLLNETYQSITLEGGKAHLLTQSGKRLVADCLLYSAGRQGNVETLGLEDLGIEMNQRGQILVNGSFQTNIPNIYAVGDVIGPPSLVSVSNREGRLAARHAVVGEEICKDCGNLPSAVYTIPEMAMIGPTEAQLQAEGVDYRIGLSDFSELARGAILGVREGLLKILFCPENNKIYAVHIMGPQASELIHIGQVVIDLGGTLEYFVDAVMNFPTLASAYKVAALQGLGDSCRIKQGL